MPSTNSVVASLPWLLRLRWLTLVGQLGAIIVAHQVLGSAVLWPVAAGLLALAAGSNLGLWIWVRKVTARAPTEHMQVPSVMGLALVFDTGLLTALLLTSGGTNNPFTILYLVYIVLAALVLDTRWTSWVTLLTALAFGSLFILPSYDGGESVDHGNHGHHTHHGHHAHHATPESGAVPNPDADTGFADHLTGMWIAFAAASAIIAYFVQQISRTLESQRTQIQELRERQAESRHLAALTTLAAGAAHELRTPLSTIAVATNELSRRLNRAKDDTTLAQNRDDLRLIELELERCQDILAAMGPDYDERFTAAELVGASELVEATVKRVRELRPDARVHVSAVESGDVSSLRVSCVRSHAEDALARLIGNALDAVERQTSKHAGAGAPPAPVRIGVAANGDDVMFTVDDDGPGMDEETLSKAVQPFFTTKDPGKGLGLGLFLVHTFAMSAAGKLALKRLPNGGLRAELSLPRATTRRPDQS